MDKPRFNQPLNIGHRGASGDYLENTLKAFRIALRQGADAVEMDIHQTRDGKLIVHHDTDLRRLAGIKKNIRDLDLGEVKGLWLKSRKKGVVYKERIPALEEALGLIRKKAVPFLEVKRGGDYYPGIEQGLIRFLRRRGLIRGVIVSSFDIPVLRRIRRLSPRLSIGLLTRETDPSSILRTARSLGAGSLHISSRRISQKILKEARLHKLPVYVYTVNSRVQMKRLLEMGVDGFFTDYPGRLHALLKRTRLRASR